MFLEWWFPRDDMDFVVRHWDQNRFAQVSVSIYEFSESRAKVSLVSASIRAEGLQRHPNHAFVLSTFLGPMNIDFLSQIFSRLFKLPLRHDGPKIYHLHHRHSVDTTHSSLHRIPLLGKISIRGRSVFRPGYFSHTFRAIGTCSASVD